MLFRLYQIWLLQCIFKLICKYLKRKHLKLKFCLVRLDCCILEGMDGTGWKRKLKSCSVIKMSFQPQL